MYYLKLMVDLTRLKIEILTAIDITEAGSGEEHSTVTSNDYNVLVTVLHTRRSAF